MKPILLLSGFDENDKKLVLKSTHAYYHQIQGQLYLSATDCADLAVWTTKDLEVIRIMKDKSWAPNLDKLQEFYFQKFIPSLDA